MDKPDQSADGPTSESSEPTVGERLRDRGHDFVERVEDAAVQAEFVTGVREETEEKAKAHIAIRLVRITVGFLVVIVGIILLPLPGPGWVVIAGGFVILSQDFVWAERTVRLIRRRVPGVPEDGKIPAGSWAMIVAVTLGAGLAAYFFGAEIRTFLSDLWSRIR